MSRFLQRFPSLLARNFRHSPANLRHSNTNLRVVPLFDRAIIPFVFFFSSDSNSARSGGEFVSKEELKKRIQSFLDDKNEDALPELFEAMMTRKLSGKHDDSDDEVMEEVRKYPVNDAHKADDSNSDFENYGLRDGDSSDSDIDSDGLRDDGTSSDSDIDSDDLRYGDSSGSDIKFDCLKDVHLSDRDIKIDGLKADHSFYSGSESD